MAAPWLVQMAVRVRARDITVLDWLAQMAVRVLDTEVAGPRG